MVIWLHSIQRYDEIGISKEKLEADPKRPIEERRKEEREMEKQMVEVMERDKRRKDRKSVV